VLSGPSGAGKSTLIREMVKEIGPYFFSISTTTRAPRAGERDGVEYFFVTREAFEADIAAGHFLEYATVHGNYYGTSIKPITKALEEGKLVVFDIDVQGHESVRKRLNAITTSVFITTPTFEVLKTRLFARQSDSLEVIEKRLTMAMSEIERVDEFDFLIVNDTLDEAVQALIHVAKAARLRRDETALNAFKTQWRKL